MRMLLVTGAERGYLGATLQQQRPGLLPRDGRTQQALSRNWRILLPTPRRPCLLPWALAVESVVSAVASVTAVPASSGSWAAVAASGSVRSTWLPALGLEDNALEAGSEAALGAGLLSCCGWPGRRESRVGSPRGLGLSSWRPRGRGEGKTHWEPRRSCFVRSKCRQPCCHRTQTREPICRPLWCGTRCSARTWPGTRGPGAQGLASPQSLCLAAGRDPPGTPWPPGPGERPGAAAGRPRPPRAPGRLLSRG